MTWRSTASRSRSRRTAATWSPSCPGHEPRPVRDRRPGRLRQGGAQARDPRVPEAAAGPAALGADRAREGDRVRSQRRRARGVRGGAEAGVEGQRERVAGQPAADALRRDRRHGRARRRRELGRGLAGHSPVRRATTPRSWRPTGTTLPRRARRASSTGGVAVGSPSERGAGRTARCRMGPATPRTDRHRTLPHRPRPKEGLWSRDQSGALSAPLRRGRRASRRV
jgi:hypothetical protein